MQLWQTIWASAFRRHSHDQAYAALVLDGAFEEAGDRGRFRVKAGDVILHDRFEAHTDRFSAKKTTVLNLPLRTLDSFEPGAAKVGDPDLIARTAAKNPSEAIELLLSMLDELPAAQADWPDALATALIEDPTLTLSRWAEEHGLAPWTVSRGFGKVFGATPESFRARVRTLRAWKSIRTTSEPLAVIACELGYADQSHMTRQVTKITGMTPSAWRCPQIGSRHRSLL